MFRELSFEYDGGKYVCLDDILTEDGGEKKTRCLVYSFGLRNDASFEEGMVQYGGWVACRDSRKKGEKRVICCFKPNTVVCKGKVFT